MMKIIPTDSVVYEYESGHQTRLSTIQMTMSIIAAKGSRGVTARELGRLLWPDDTSGKSRAGSPLTRLNQEGKLVALMTKREGHHVYVLPERVEGREVWHGYRHRGHCATCTCDEQMEDEA
jgi:hypothetical protein